MVPRRIRARCHRLATYFLGILTLVLLIPALAAGRSQAPAPPTHSQTPVVRGGPPPALAIFFTGEVMGWTEPCG